MQLLNLICECAISRRVPGAAVRRVVANASAAGEACEIIPDLCELAACQDARLRQWAARPALKIHACHPRAVKALFAHAGAPLSAAATSFSNLREAETSSPLPVEAIARRVQEAGPSDGRWMPWFPVIDPARCTHCQQCLGFCLFGVYELSSEGRVVVANPRACKTHCPACARICPGVAIIFPKHDEAPINGAEISDEALEQARVKADLQQLLGNDPFTALAARRKKAGTRQVLRQNAQPEREQSAGGQPPAAAIAFRPPRRLHEPPAAP